MRRDRLWRAKWGGTVCSTTRRMGRCGRFAGGGGERCFQARVFDGENGWILNNLECPLFFAVPFSSPFLRPFLRPLFFATQLLSNLPTVPISRLSDWLPDQWKLRKSLPSG